MKATKLLMPLCTVKHQEQLHTVLIFNYHIHGASSFLMNTQISGLSVNTHAHTHTRVYLHE